MWKALEESVIRQKLISQRIHKHTDTDRQTQHWYVVVCRINIIFRISIKQNRDKLKKIIVASRQRICLKMNVCYEFQFEIG